MTNEAINPKTLDLISKLHALATNKGATEAEASNAMAKMQALLAKHNLDISDVNMTQEQHNDQVDSRVQDIRNPWRANGWRPGNVQWMVDLASAIARYNFGAVLVGRSNTYVRFVGKIHNIEAIKEMWSYAVEQVVALADEGYVTTLDAKATDKRIWKRNFAMGCVIRLIRRLHDEWLAMQQASVDTKALVVVNDTAVSAYVERIGSGKSAKTFNRGNVAPGLREGHAAGDRVNLGPRAKQLAN